MITATIVQKKAISKPTPIVSLQKRQVDAVRIFSSLQKKWAHKDISKMIRSIRTTRSTFDRT